MEAYFTTHSGQFTLAGQGATRLRNNQIGAICAVRAHFTLSDQAALVAMPTGSGKTAVLMAAAFVLAARRVLVITPSVVVREQIAEAFQSLSILKKTGSVPEDLEPPNVKEVTGYLGDQKAWEELAQYDVVVAAPPSVSPANDQVAEPPRDLFDLVLIDEAHHAAARTWRALLDHFHDARQVLCSATPFRNDRHDLNARIVYHYPLKRAQQEGIFGKITYEAVTAADDEADVLIALKAQEIYDRDRALGFDHRLMVRTTQKNRAKTLKAVYKEHTNLRLEEIHSDLGLPAIKSRLQKLRSGELDGVICVDMMGEGFDFPNLKIAAVHAPHTSLPITLQFIGRFARTGFQGQPIGEATFIAEEHAVRHDEYRLYSLDEPDWGEIVANLGDRRVQKEVDLQDFFDTFNRIFQIPDDDEYPVRHLRLGYLEPFHHVKVYRLTDQEEFHLDAVLQAPGINPLHTEISRELNVSVTIWAETNVPRWLRKPLLQDLKYHLLVVYFDKRHNLLYICSSKKEDDLYDAVIAAFASAGASELPAPILKRVMTDWTDPEIYSLGMQNRQAAIGQESYRIVAGGAAQHAVSRNDGRKFTRGHAFGASVEPGGKQTLGISSRYAKIWSLQNADIHRLIDWCNSLSRKLTDPAADSKPTPVDMLDGGHVIQSFPDPQESRLLMVDWPADIYKVGHHRRLRLVSPQYPAGIELQPLDFDLQVCSDESTKNRLRFDVLYGSEAVQCALELTPEPKHRVLPDQTCEITVTQHGRPRGDFALYLDSFAPMFWFEDLSTVTRNIQYDSVEFSPRVAPDTFNVHDWDAGGVDITGEITPKMPGKISIQQHLRDSLAGQHQIVFFDHDTGEAADFITLDLTDDQFSPIKLQFFHCKGSKEAKPGSRVEDVYEVLGQAIKCLRFQDRAVLQSHLLKRERDAQPDSRYVTGSQSDLLAILKAHGPRLLPITVWVVQPGIDSRKVEREEDRKLHRLVERVQYSLSDQGCSLQVMCS